MVQTLDENGRSYHEATESMVAPNISLDETLLAVAELAKHEVAAADGVGLTLYGQYGIDRMVGTAPFVSDVDRIQYGFGQGPCLSAAAEQRTVRSGQLGDDSRWALFGAQVRQLGVHSALSLPMTVSAGVIGTLNIYAYPRDAFSDESTAVGELYAAGAAIAVQHAVVLNSARVLSRQLHAIMTGHAAINQAVGVLMVEDDLEAGPAFAALRELAAETSVDLADAATAVVQQAAAHEWRG